MKYIKKFFICLEMIFAMILGAVFVAIGNIGIKYDNVPIYSFFIDKALYFVNKEYKCATYIADCSIEELIEKLKGKYKDAAMYLYERGFLDV